MPAKTVLFDAKCKPVFDLGTGPYNIIRWNPQVPAVWPQYCSMLMYSIGPTSFTPCCASSMRVVVALMGCNYGAGPVLGTVWIWQLARGYHLPGQKGRWQVQGHQPGQVCSAALNGVPCTMLLSACCRSHSWSLLAQTDVLHAVSG